MNKTRSRVFVGVMLLSSALSAAPTEKVTFKTTDGVALNALFSKPGAGKPTVIMHHGLGAWKEEWQPLIDFLVENGTGVFSYDARPAGTPWQKLVDDMGTAVRFVEGRGVDRKSVFLAGASLGANVCLKYNALTNTGRGLILLSPGLNYQGLETLDAVKMIKIPILFVAHPADRYAFHSVTKLAPQASHATSITSQKPGHGVQMFDADLLNKIHLWMEKQK